VTASPATETLTAPSLTVVHIWARPERLAYAAVVVFWLIVVVASMPLQLVQDSWLALASGREVAQHGLPHTDSLTAWTAGHPWIDQQWLGQLFYYHVELLGGIRGVLLTHGAVLVAAVAMGLHAARRLGASIVSLVIGGLVALSVAPWGMQMRTQDLGELLFIALLALLATDARAPSRRVYFVLPLLVLWANVHGSVILGSMLVVLRGLTLLHGSLRNRRRATALTIAALLAPVASPYGFSLVGYYRHMLADPALHRLINEWGPTTPSLHTAAFYGLAAATIWATARHGAGVPLFNRAALLLTLLAAVDSIRNIVWFGLAAIVLLPPLLNPVLSHMKFTSFRRRAPSLTVVTAAAGLAAIAFAATRTTAWMLSAWPLATEAEQVSAIANATPSGRVLADGRYADWLLWNAPELRGRLAYDVRFELLNNRQTALLFNYNNRIGDNWRTAATGYPIIVLDPVAEGQLKRSLVARSRYTEIAQTPGLAILKLRPGVSQDGTAGR
jgi:hypothetical protein